MFWRIFGENQSAVDITKETAKIRVKIDVPISAEGRGGG